MSVGGSTKMNKPKRTFEQKFNLFIYSSYIIGISIFGFICLFFNFNEAFKPLVILMLVFIAFVKDFDTGD